MEAQGSPIPRGGDEVKVFHRSHASPNTDKGAVASLRKWLESKGVKND